ALGVLLYELITGRPPFMAAAPLDTIHKVVQEKPVPPSQLRPGTPPDLESICLKCLEKDPRRRYLSARALAADLGRFERGEQVDARPLGSPGRAARMCKRNPVTSGGLAVLAVMLLGGVSSLLVAILSSGHQSEPGPSPEIPPSVAKNSGPVTETYAQIWKRKLLVLWGHDAEVT